ncbi:MAG: hypothetical protein ABI478_10075 [Propionivibrio sp.]
MNVKTVVDGRLPLLREKRRRPARPSPLRLADVRGATHLATQATIEVSHIVEGVHRSVLGSIGLASGVTPGRTGGVSGLVYRSIRGIAYWVGRGTNGILATLEKRLTTDEPGPSSPQREAVLAVLNGIIGDRLAASGSPLATPMRLLHDGEPVTQDNPQVLQTGKVSGKIVLLIHGLCMNNRHWQTRNGDPVAGHGAALAAQLGYTPLYLRYNSGLHVSDNGRELSRVLEQLLAGWPVAVEEISVVAHSMGGLIIRSAAQHAEKEGLRWRERLQNIVFLGTPHHGAPLERGGNLLDAVLGSTRFTAPFARLGRVRSAGITDLRYGHVREDDWHGHDRFVRRGDARSLLPLPENVACFAFAATIIAKTAAQRGLLADRLVGDGLVPLRSALGEHADPRRSLCFAKASRAIIYHTGHNALLTDPEVTRKIVRWLTPT